MNKISRILRSGTYSLKPGFQNLLIQFMRYLVKHSYTPNQITLFTCFSCVLYSAFLALPTTSHLFLLLLPIFLITRMAFNALDGMIAIHTQNQTAQGVVYNEICDVVSDLVLFSAFLFILPAYHLFWVVLIALSLLTEFVSLAIFQAVGIRPYLGPFGKSDRAVYLGLTAFILIIFPNNFVLLQIFIILGIILASLTIWNRMKLVKQAGN